MQDLSKDRKSRLIRRLKNKKIGSKNWLKLQQKIAKIHEKIADSRKDWHFKLAHNLCDQTDNIFVEDINFKSWSRGIVRKQSLDSGIGQFINEILPYICWKRGKFYQKVDKNFTSQECPNCHQKTGKKQLSERLHHCQFCGYQENRDIVSAKVIKNRGLIACTELSRSAVEQPVIQNACGDGSTGLLQNQNVKASKESVIQESPATPR